jgi:DNA-binding NarL/FixJ family response regulator
MTDPSSDRRLSVLVASADVRVRVWAQRTFPADVRLCAAGLDGPIAGADVCLLDLRLPGVLAAIVALRDATPAIRIVAWSATEDDPALVEAVNAGATACLVGQPDRRAVTRTLDDLMAGRAALPRALVARLVAQLHVA